MLDDALLSHGETPHYHRRSAVSLLSSEWDQVVPTLYLRQAIRFCTPSLRLGIPDPETCNAVHLSNGA